MTPMTRFTAAVLLAFSFTCGCGSDAQLDRTLATAEQVRGGATLDDEPIGLIARAAPGQRLTIDEHSLARLRLDSGAHLLMDGGASVVLSDESTLTLEGGRVYAEASESDELYLVAGERSIRASDAAVSASLDGALTVYVVRGEVSWIRGEDRGVAQAGEELTLGAQGEPATEPVTLWRDWTGGLAQPGPADARGAEGVGVLEARVPDEIGQARWPLVIRRLDVQVRIVGDLAVTEVEQVFFNPASEMVEGFYRIRVPEASVLQRFAVDRNGHLVDGYIREKAQARQAYQQQVYRGSQLDPALLEWIAPGRYRARIYPIRPGETRRIVVRYAEWLAPIREGGPRLYRYPMGGGRAAPRVQELSLAVDVEEAGVERMRAGMGAAVEEGRVRLRRSDFAPRSDFWLELNGPAQPQRAWRAPHEPPPRAPDARVVVGEADERDYWYMPLRLPERLFENARADGVDLVIVADVSAGTDRSHLELGRSMTEALTAHLGANDRVAIVRSDLTIRSLSSDEVSLGEASPERVERLLDGLARASAGGATDLGAAIGAAAALLDPSRSGAVVYVGDGAPTVGELEADGLLERMARLPEPLRLYAIGVGSDANLELLEVLTRGGGLAMRVEERSAAADAALRVLGHATRPVAQRVTVELGAGIENVYPRRPVDVVEGEVLSVSGRIRETPPTTVRVRGSIAGQDFDEELPVQTGVTEQSTDLRLRWAGERLRQLLLDGAGREEVAELGVRYGLITPFSSFYVPSAAELNQLGPTGLRWIDQPDLFDQIDRERREEGSVAQSIFAIALAPLAIAGCAGDESDDAVSAAMEESSMADWESEEEMPAVAEVAPAPTAQAVAPEPEPSMDAPSPEEPMDLAAAPMGATSADGFGTAERAAAQAPPPTTTAAPVIMDALGSGRGGGGSGATTGSPAFGPRAASQARPAPRRRRSRASGGSRNGRQTASVSGSTTRAEADRTRDNRADLLSILGADEDTEQRAPDIGRLLGESSGADANVFTVRTTIRGNRDRVREHAARHARRRCSDAASRSLSDRQELWRERLGARSNPGGWLAVYREAIAACEAPSWRARRTLLSLILASAGNVQRMISVYRVFTSGSARGYLRAAILRRVRSPRDLRAVRGAFGLGREPDWALVEQVLERARNDAARLTAMRRLSMQYSESFDLKLRLLEMLETQGHEPEARRLADQLRTDARSDAGVRTAVGEMYLRMGHEEEARRVFSEIVEFAPLDELARRRLGDLYRAHGWFEDAYRQYQTLATIRPDDPTALLLLAQAAAGTGRIDEALRLEQRLMETAQPGSERGIARVAQLWTSVRLAKLRHTAREAGDEERLAALGRRVRRSGVLSSSGDLRATLVWSHPDAQIGLYAAHPDQPLARPAEIAPEYGIEAFSVPEQESGTYRFEVRRADPEAPTQIEAELVLVWHEGRADEVVRIVPLVFSEGREDYAWTLRADAFTEVND